MPTKKQAAGKQTASSRAIDLQLARYREMRDFKMTAEPAGGGLTANSEGLPFVIQKHAATRLHYDFRLGWKGVLKSWAVTKGPSYDPADKRLAVQVEDHPIEYGGFEGAIPKGQYGGGTVMVWDQGTWVPLTDVDQGLRDGHLKFELRGEKLKGSWALVRMGGRAADPRKPNWLLIKEHDGNERPGATPVTEESPKSVSTGRTLEEIAADKDHVWDSQGHAGDHAGAEPAPEKKPRSEAKAQANREESPLVEAAPREPFPAFIAPQLAAHSGKPPDGEEWVHELKLDGYRVQAHVQRGARAGGVKLLTRNGLDWTQRMSAIAEAAAKLDVESAVLDGEVVVLDDSGGTSFAALQAAFQDGARHHLTYFAFDLLHLNGRDLRGLPLIERKEILAGVLRSPGDADVIRISEHLRASGSGMFQQACKLGAEGIVSKLAASKYVSGRGGAWLKSKCVREQEFVVGGFTPPSHGGHGIGALLLGYYEGDRLIYAGRAGTGFTQKMQATLRQRLDALVRKQPAFDALPAAARTDAVWVEPRLVAQVAFATWTQANLLRQAAFKGLREDKEATEVVREMDDVPDAANKDKTKRATKATISRTATRKAEAIEIAGVRMTHPDKVLDEASGLTKEALALYYVAVSEHMLPYIAGRPLSIVRCPEGSGKPCFFQKHIGRGLPEGVGSVSVPDRKGGPDEEYITVSSVEGMVGLVQMGVLEVHPWGSRNDALEVPDRLIFDLDPDAAIAWSTLAETARKVRASLKRFGLESFVKGTGGKGLHVVSPIRPEHPWPVIKAFAHAVVDQLEAGEPELYVTRMTKAARKGRIYLDYLRNDRGATAIAPFSSRARAGAPISLPLAWKELAADAMPAFSVADAAGWKARLRRDPWATMSGLDQGLDAEAVELASALKA